MVEVNSTFYSVPEPPMVERWNRSTPADFVFDVKLHQLFSRHATAGRLLPPELQRMAAIDSKGRVKPTGELEAALLKYYVGLAEHLRAAGKMGAFLLQMTPAFSPAAHDLEELEFLLRGLATYGVALEFRNRHWVEGEQLERTLAFLRQHAVTLVSVDAPAQDHFTIMPSGLDEITAPRLAYLRLHGRNARAYLRGKTVATRFDYDYRDSEIEEVAERALRLAGAAREVHVIFNNNNLDQAPRAALRLRAVLGQIARLPAAQPELFD